MRHKRTEIWGIDGGLYPSTIMTNLMIPIPQLPSFGSVCVIGGGAGAEASEDILKERENKGQNNPSNND